MTRDQIIAELEKSFKFLKQAMANTPDAKLEEQPNFELRKITTRGLWIANHYASRPVDRLRPQQQRDASLEQVISALVAYAHLDTTQPTPVI